MTREIRFCTSADGTRIGFTIYGQPTSVPLLVVRAWASTIGTEEEFEEARAFYAELAEDRGIIRFDLRGTGASQRTVQDVSLDAQVADAEAVVKHLRLTRFDMFAFAGGAQIGALYTARHSDQVRHLVLWAPHAYGPEAIRKRDAISGMIALALANWPLACRTMADVLFPSGPDDTRRRWAHMLRDQGRDQEAMDALDRAAELGMRASPDASRVER